MACTALAIVSMEAAELAIEHFALEFDLEGALDGDE